MDRDLIECLRLAVEHADILDLQQRRLIFEIDFAACSSLDRAAEIDAAHGLVLHHVAGCARDDFLAEIHRQHAIDQCRHALDVVVDQQHGAALVAKTPDQFGERTDFRQGEARERLIDKHDFWVARDRLG